MKGISEFNKAKVNSGVLQKLWGGKDIKTTLGDPENPQYSDVWRDNDNNNKWSEGDSIVVTKLEAI